MFKRSVRGSGKGAPISGNMLKAAHENAFKNEKTTNKKQGEYSRTFLKRLRWKQTHQEATV